MRIFNDETALNKGIESDRTANATRLGERCVPLKAEESVNVSDDDEVIAEQWPEGLDSDFDVPPEGGNTETPSELEVNLALQLQQLQAQNQKLLQDFEAAEAARAAEAAKLRQAEAARAAEEARVAEAVELRKRDNENAKGALDAEWSSLAAQARELDKAAHRQDIHETVISNQRETTSTDNGKICERIPDLSRQTCQWSCRLPMPWHKCAESPTTRGESSYAKGVSYPATLVTQRRYCTPRGSSHPTMPSPSCKYCTRVRAVATPTLPHSWDGSRTLCFAWHWPNRPPHLRTSPCLRGRAAAVGCLRGQAVANGKICESIPNLSRQTCQWSCKAGPLGVEQVSAAGVCGGKPWPTARFAKVFQTCPGRPVSGAARLDHWAWSR